MTPQTQTEGTPTLKRFAPEQIEEFAKKIHYRLQEARRLNKLSGPDRSWGAIGDGERAVCRSLARWHVTETMKLEIAMEWLVDHVNEAAMATDEGKRLIPDTDIGLAVEQLSRYADGPLAATASVALEALVQRVFKEGPSLVALAAQGKKLRQNIGIEAAAALEFVAEVRDKLPVAKEAAVKVLKDAELLGVLAADVD